MLDDRSNVMKSDLKEKLTQLEAEVAVIKDPALRQIAFGKLLDSVVAPPKSEPEPSRSKKMQKTPDTGSPRKSKGGNKASAFYATGQVREEVQKLTLTGTAKGLPNFRDAKKEWERYMWVLAA